MSDLPRRPVSVWIAQILLLLIGLLFAIFILIATLRNVAWFGRNSAGPETALLIVLVSVFRFGILAVLVLSFWGLARRRRYGRWLSVAVFLLILIFSVVGQVYRPNGPVEYYEYSNSTERLGGLIGSLFIYGLFGLLLYQLAVSKSVSEFFDTARKRAIIDEPPPPQAFFNDTADGGNKD